MRLDKPRSLLPAPVGTTAAVPAKILWLMRSPVQAISGWLGGRLVDYLSHSADIRGTSAPTDADKLMACLKAATCSWSKGTFSRYPAVVQAIHLDDAWTLVAGAKGPIPKLGACTDFGSLKMPVLLATGEKTAARYKQLISEQQNCLSMRLSVADTLERSRLLA